ncbi:transposase [Streptomyces tendae]|uniref:transposase n=1 Tax=Streptomyces tendae TaxID=1932 RepID=UPI003795BADA
MLDGSHARVKRASRHRSVAGRPRKTGSNHHLICDGRGAPLKVVTTAANVNDVTLTLALVDGVPPAGRPGRPRRRTEALLGERDTTPTPTAASCASAGSCRSLPQGQPEHQGVLSSSTKPGQLS